MTKKILILTLLLNISSIFCAEKSKAMIISRQNYPLLRADRKAREEFSQAMTVNHTGKRDIKTFFVDDRASKRPKAQVTYIRNMPQDVFEKLLAFFLENISQPGKPGALYTALVEILELRAVSRSWNESIKKVFRQKNIDLNTVDAMGRTALHLAAFCGRNDVVIFLLDNGVDIEQADIFGQTALHYGVLSNNPSTVSVLVKRGANVNALTHKVVKDEPNNYFPSYFERLPNYKDCIFKLNPPWGNWELIKAFSRDWNCDLNKDLKYEFINFSALHFAILMNNEQMINILKAHYQFQGKAVVKVHLKKDHFTSFDINFNYEAFPGSAQKYFHLVNDPNSNSNAGCIIS